MQYTAGDHNCDDNNSIHERPLQDVGFFSVAHILLATCVGAHLYCVYQLYTINYQWADALERVIIVHLMIIYSSPHDNRGIISQ